MDTGLRELERRLGLGGLAEGLAGMCAGAPDPGGSALRAARVLDAAAAADAPGLSEAWRRDGGALLDALRAVCGVAPFLTRFFTSHPRWLCQLAADELATPRSGAAYASRLAAALADVPSSGEGEALRSFKYYELARVVARDAGEARVPLSRAGETLAELSHLADALLARALAGASEQLAARIGPPEWTRSDGSRRTLGFCVLGLGKLGGEELNFSSDVDLVYVFESSGEPEGSLRGGPVGLSPQEYFTRLAQEFGRRVGESAAEGFLYRLDLDLRPEGAQGSLVVSSDALAHYYEAWAASWERAAFMKARPVAGDLDFGWRVARSLHPMIFPSSMDLAGVAAIRELKQRVETEHALGGDFDVKLSAGGIRDVEFVAHALQLLHGGRIPQVRSRSTQEALAALGEAGLLARERADELLAAYRFLRRVENRLQMREERQVHRVPTDPRAREELARAMGHVEPGGLAAFDEELAEHRRRVGESFEGLLSEKGGERILALFARGASGLFAVPSTRAMLEQLAAHFAREIEAAANPELALVNLDRFVEGIGNRTFYVGLLLDRPEIVPRLAALFGSSRYLSSFFAAHPDLIEPVFRDPTVFLLPRAELERDFEEIRGGIVRQGGRDPVEVELAALRFFHHRELVNVALLDLAGKIGLAEAEASLSDVAEVCLGRALALAAQQLAARAPARPGEFAVVGMGKLGSRELTYGSDLDVIFVYDVPGGGEGGLLEVQEHFIRLAQKLVWALHTRTAEGACYAVDARLRPSGSQGMLVTSLDALRAYHARSAQAWERQALLRARPVAGSPRLAAEFDELRREILRQPPPPDLAAEMHRIRLRMEIELAHEARGRRDLKTGRGGLLDVEDVVQYLQLQHGMVFPQLLEPDPIATQLARAAELELVEPEAARVLGEGWEFLRRLASRLRVVENRSISEFDERRADLESVARALGYAPSPRTGEARRPLLEDYRRHTEAIRQVYLRVLGVAPGAARPPVRGGGGERGAL